MSKDILIIESDFEAARQMASALESEGYFVYTASTAEAGMDMARRVKPSILFLSPSVEGLSENGVVDFIKDLHSQEASKDIPVMLVTEGDKEYDPRYSAMYGIINFIKKPIEPAEVLFKCRASIEDVPETPISQGPEMPEKILAVNRDTGFGHSEGASPAGDGPEKMSAGRAEGEARPEDPGPIEDLEAINPEEGQPIEQKSGASEVDPFEDILKGFKKEGAKPMDPKWKDDDRLSQTLGSDQDFMPFGQPRKRRGLGMKIIYVVLIVLAGAAVSFGVVRYIAVKRNNEAKKELKAAKVDNSPVIVQQTLPPAPAASNSAAAPAMTNTPAATSPINPVVNQATPPANAAAPEKLVAVAKAKPAVSGTATAQVKSAVKPATQENKSRTLAQARPKPVRKPEKTRVAKAPKRQGGVHLVQAGVFASRANATKLEKRLRNKGYPVSISRTINRGRAAYRVLVGRYSTSAEAEKVEKKMKRQGFSAIVK